MLLIKTVIKSTRNSSTLNQPKSHILFHKRTHCRTLLKGLWLCCIMRQFVFNVLVPYFEHIPFFYGGLIKDPCLRNKWARKASSCMECIKRASPPCFGHCSALAVLYSTMLGKILRIVNLKLKRKFKVSKF